MKTHYSLLVCAVFVIFLAPDVKSAPVIDMDINECTVCCQQEDCLAKYNTSHDAHVTILNNLFLHDFDMCGGDMGCAMEAWNTHMYYLTIAGNDLDTCTDSCLLIHP